MASEKGVVKWFSNEKGYGFIRQEGGNEVFVHHSDIDGDGFRTLRQGERVEFDIFQSDKGPKARNVVRLESPGSSDRSVAGRSSAGQAESGGESSHKRTLAEQIREKLGGRFMGFGG